MESMVDLYDSDLLKIEQVDKVLGLHLMQHMDLERYVQEVKERYGEAGYLVDVVMFQVTGPGPLPVGSFMPEISIIARVTPEEFDREKMTWEVQHDILEIDPNPGAVQLDGTVRSPGQVTSFTKP